jgi:hypothetical protein
MNLECKIIKFSETPACLEYSRLSGRLIVIFGAKPKMFVSAGDAGFKSYQQKYKKVE